MTKRSLIGYYNDGKKKIPIKGFIELIGLDNYTFKLIWQIFDNELKIVAVKGRAFFHGGNPPSTQEMFDKGIEEILKYRINRRKVFEGIELVI